MPAPDAPVISSDPEVPHLSYKIQKPGGPLTFVVSADGGKTNTDSGLDVLCGVPVDLRLEISAATWQKGETDYRLRFQFIDQEGYLCEVNVNSINPMREDPTQKVITGPARSLLGGLLRAAQSPDDMEALMSLMRISLKKGKRDGTFIDLDGVRDSDEGQTTWTQFSGAKSTMQIAQGPYGLVEAVTRIKSAFRAEGYLGDTPAVIGQVPMGAGQPGVVPVLVNAEVVEN